MKANPDTKIQYNTKIYIQIKNINLYIPLSTPRIIAIISNLIHENYITTSQTHYI